MSWTPFLERMPLIAILRGLTPGEAVAIADVLHEAGFTCLEVPLNSPEPLKSIAAIRAAFADKLYVGAGTVLSAEDVASTAIAGAQFIVSPNVNADVIAAAKRHGLQSMPGFFTATEALAAAAAGADALKLFPADSANPSHLKALKAVLPKSLPVFAVGGISASNMWDWMAAGAAGLGIGGALYAPGDTPRTVARKASEMIASFRKARA